MKRGCRKSYQAMFSGLRLPFVAKRETLKRSTGFSTNQCNIRENTQRNVRYQREHIFLLLPSQTQGNTNTASLLLLLLLLLMNVENNLPLMWKMKGINRKMCGTVRQMRDLPLNIALKEDFVMILLFNFRQKPWYFYELEDSKERAA